LNNQGNLNIKFSQTHDKALEMELNFLEASTFQNINYCNLGSYLKYVKPDAFYVVLNKDGNYKYYKFENGELKKRKVDKYVSFLRESNGSENEVDQIVDTMLDFIDEGEKIIRGTARSMGIEVKD
jgi:hypothetical protein